MSTTFSEILTSSAMQFIDDPRWSEQLALNPAQFFRAKSQALIMAIPRFNRPPNIQSFFAYKNSASDDYTYIVTEEDTFPKTLETGLQRYELVCVGTVVKSQNGSVTYTPYKEFVYDDITGNVILNEAIPAETTVEIDFYTDGQFENDLDDTQKRIMGLCVAYDWYYKFANSFYNVLNPVTDKTFSPRSAPSEDKRSNTSRMKELWQQLSSELLAYEQGLYIRKYMPHSSWHDLVTPTN